MKEIESVYVLDDDKTMRTLLKRILEGAGYKAETFASGEDFFREEPPLGPACLLLDVQLPGLDGPDIHKKFEEMDWPISVVYVTAFATVPMTVDMIRAGAVDVLCKPLDFEKVIGAVQKALQRSREKYARHLQQADIGVLVRQITAREHEVMCWVIAGKLNKQIATILGITERTVKAHRARIMEKLGVSSVVELVRFADKAGIRPSVSIDL